MITVTESKSTKRLLVGIESEDDGWCFGAIDVLEFELAKFLPYLKPTARQKYV